MKVRNFLSDLGVAESQLQVISKGFLQAVTPSGPEDQRVQFIWQ